MRILYVIKNLVPHTGNSVTIARIAKLIRQKGHTVKILSLSKVKDIKKEIIKFTPDIIHAFHAFHSKEAVRVASTLDIPVVLTITGTDVNHYAKLKSYRKRFLSTVESADAVTVFHKDFKKNIAFTKNVFVVPQSVSFKNVKWKNCDKFELLLVSNIRPVKNNLFVIKASRLLLQDIPDLHLFIIGKKLDEKYYQKCMSKMKNQKHITYLGEVPHNKIFLYYKCVSVVLNSSLSEGGMANSLLEAMYLKIPVVASKIPGNTTIVKEGKTGLLFEDVQSFRNQILRLYNEKKLREKLSGNAYKMVRQEMMPRQERDGYIKIYDLICKTKD
jgi:L-malate glycosyltransferase